MKKTFIATKEIKNLGLHQVVSTIDTNECTTETKVYYNGKIYKKETYFHEHKQTNEQDWNGNLEHYKSKEYIILIV